MKPDKLIGQVLVIGNFSYNFIEKINNNPKVTFCDHLAPSTKAGFGRGNNQIINIKKLKKRYQKNSFDYIIINPQEIEKYQKYWLKDSIILGKNKIIIENYNQKIINKYQRYNVKIKKQTKNQLMIDVSQAKTTYFKEKKYQIIDFFEKIIDSISDFLSI